MINVTLPANSFATAVIYNGSGVIYDRQIAGSARQKVEMTRYGDRIVLQPPHGSTFTLQLLGVNGSVKRSFSSRAGGQCVIDARELSKGMYLLRGTIDGERFYSRIPVANY
jgi:hypothetical protein